MCNPAFEKIKNWQPGCNALPACWCAESLSHSHLPANTHSAKGRLPTSPPLLAAAQRRETAPSVGVDVIPLLKAALAAQSRPHTRSYIAGE